MGQFWAIFGPITQPTAIYFFKKSFKWILMAMRMLFRGNLGKLSEQIGVNLHKNAILGQFGLFLDPLGAPPCRKIFFLGWKF